MTATMSRPRVENAILLPDGRRLGFAEYGDPHGKPLMSFHGLPSSRLDCSFAHAACVEIGVRLIAPDRPGMGLSDFQPGRRLVDWPRDVVALADALQLDTFAVMGTSGGGPYAAVCAHAIADRLTAAGILCGMGLADIPGGLEGVAATDRRMMMLARRAPWLARVIFAAVVAFARRRPDLALKSFEGEVSPTDKVALARLGPPREAIRFFVESFRRGARGPVHDYRIAAGSWGFRLEEITIPVGLWHGGDDPVVPLRQAKEIVARIPRSQLTVFPGEGHLFFFDHHREIIRQLTIPTS